MTSFKRYFLYHLKSRVGYTAIVSLLGFLTTLISLIEEHGGNVTENTDSLFGIPAAILSITALLSAVLEFAPFLSRRNLDTLYAMPISRRSMQLVHYLSGLISTLTSHAVSFLLTVIFWLPYGQYFSLVYAIPLYFISIVCGAIMYAIAVFLFSKGNTIVDGCLTLVLGGCAMPLFLLAVFTYRIFWKHFDFDTSSTFLWAPINEYTDAYQKLIQQDTYLGILDNPPYFHTLAEFYQEKSTIIMTVLFLLLGIAAVLGFFLYHPKKPIETVGEITTSFFSYRTMIPLYAFSVITIIGIDAIGICLLLACMVAGYIIYRRTYRLKRSDLIMMGAFVLYTVIASLL